jgi:hypothetical protein
MKGRNLKRAALSLNAKKGINAEIIFMNNLEHEDNKSIV